MRFDASMESLINIGRSESFADLNETDLALSRSFLNQGRDVFNLQGTVKNSRNISRPRIAIFQLYFLCCDRPTKCIDSCQKSSQFRWQRYQ